MCDQGGAAEDATCRPVESGRVDVGAHLESNLELLARQRFIAWAGIEGGHFTVRSWYTLICHLVRCSCKGNCLQWSYQEHASLRSVAALVHARAYLLLP
jgi:hypothetical protein